MSACVLAILLEWLEFGWIETENLLVVSLLIDVLAIIGGLTSIAAFMVAVVQAYRLWKWHRQPSWNEALKTAEKVLEQIEGSAWMPGIVLGIGRSGGIWGGWVAGNLGSLPFAVIDCKIDDESGPARRFLFQGGQSFADNLREVLPENKKILIIEGAVTTGGTFGAFFEQFGTQFEDCEIKTATLYRNPSADFIVDYVGRSDLEPWPQKFPWHFRKAYRPFLRDAIVR